MYGTNTMNKVIAGSVSTGAGIVALPATSGNNVGMILAYAAIAIGVIAILSQVVVRVLRHRYQAK